MKYKAMRKRLFFISTVRVLFVAMVAVLLLSIEAAGQEVEHNYLVGPQFTDCDSLKMDGLTAEQAIEKIRKTKYRFDQKFRLTRKQGLQKGEFYSCDNQTGYLVITFDGQELLYFHVNKDFWNNLITSTDPEGYILKTKDSLRKWPGKHE